MVNEIRASDLRGIRRGCGSKFRVRQETYEEGWRTYRPKHWEYNDEDYSPKTINDKKYYYCFFFQ